MPSILAASSLATGGKIHPARTRGEHTPCNPEQLRISCSSSMTPIARPSSGPAATLWTNARLVNAMPTPWATPWLKKPLGRLTARSRDHGELGAIALRHRLNCAHTCLPSCIAVKDRKDGVWQRQAFDRRRGDHGSDRESKGGRGAVIEAHTVCLFMVYEPERATLSPQ